MPNQGPKGVARQHHLFLQRYQLQARLRQATFALTQLQPVIQTGVDTVLHKFEGFFPLRQRAARHVGLLVQAHQLKIHARHIAGQQHSDGLCICLSRLGVAQRGIKRGAVLTKKI